MISQQEKDEYFEILKSEFHANVAAGLKNSPAMKKAKATTNAAYPAISELFKYGMGPRKEDDAYREAHTMSAKMTGFWKNLYAEADEWRKGSNGNGAAPTPLPLPPGAAPVALGASNGADRTRRKPGIVTYASGLCNVTDTVLSGLKAIEVKPGEVLDLGDLRLLNYALGCSPSAIPNLILSSGGQVAMEKAGYQVTAVDKSYRHFVVRFDSVPMTATEKETANLRAQLAELAARLAELEGRK